MADDKQQDAGGTPDQGETPTYDEWYSGQGEDVRGLIDGHTQGLRSALDSERAQAKTLAKELKALSGKLDANSEAAKELETVRTKLESAQAQAEFYETATAAGCRDLRLAWLVASADDLTVDQVKARHPDLFMVARPAAANAGNGAATPPQPGRSMNDYIRRAAGRG